MDEQARQACEERVPGEGSVFAVCRRFLPEDRAAAALAAEALVRSVAAVPLTVSDPGVGAVKLKWWQDAVPDAGPDPAPHPVIRATQACGLHAVLDASSWRRYVTAVAGGLDADPSKTIDDVLDALRSGAGLATALIAGLDERDGRFDAFADAGAAHALLERLEALASGDGRPGWLPLDLLARHAQLDEEAARVTMLEDLADAGIRRLQAGEGIIADGLESPAAAYLEIRDRVVRRRLRRLRERPRRVVERGVVGLTDVWTAWRSARRLAARMPS